MLGWVAGEIMIKDAAAVGYLGAEFVERAASLGGRGRRRLRGGGGLVRSGAAEHKPLLERPLIVDPPGPEDFPHKQVSRPRGIGLAESRTDA